MQRRPPGFEHTCPISPAEPRPVSFRPSITMPPPTPGAPEHTEERVEPATGAEAMLGVDRDVDVVADPHGPAELRGERRPEREGSIPAFDVRDLEHGARLGVDRPGRADADPGDPHRLDAGVVERRAQRLGELEDDRLGPALARVSRRALPSTVDSPFVTTAWIFVPPRSSPPFIRVTTATARPRRSACGSRARSIPRPCAAPHRAAAPAARRRGRSPASPPRPRRAPSGPARRR